LIAPLYQAVRMGQPKPAVTTLNSRKSPIVTGDIQVPQTRPDTICTIFTQQQPDCLFFAQKDAQIKCTRCALYLFPAGNLTLEPQPCPFSVTFKQFWIKHKTGMEFA
jgi:hypothetical protein